VWRRSLVIPARPGVVELSFTPQENVGTVPVAIPVVTGGPVHDPRSAADAGSVTRRWVKVLVRDLRPGARAETA